MIANPTPNRTPQSVKITRPPMHNGQRAILSDPTRFKVIVCGRRWGKTYLGAWAVFERAMGRGACWWVAPNYPIATIGWRIIKRLARQYPRATILEGERRVDFPGGGFVQVKSAHDPDSLRAEGLDLVVIDEAAMIQERAWSEALRPTLVTRKGGAIFISTPKGRNWFFHLWERENTDPAHWKSWQQPTYSNPLIPEGEIDQAKMEMSPDEFSQEIEANFLSYTGLVYPEFNRRQHIRNSDKQLAFKRVIAGVDWGFVNPGVILVVGINSDNSLHVLHEDYTTQRGIDSWVAVARQYRDLYNISEFYCDPSEPDYIRKFIGAGLKAYGADNTLSTGIQAVKARLSTGQLTLCAGATNTAREFDIYGWAKPDVPVNANDHALDALRYAIMAVDSNKTKKVTSKTESYV